MLGLKACYHHPACFNQDVRNRNTGSDNFLWGHQSLWHCYGCEGLILLYSLAPRESWKHTALPASPALQSFAALHSVLILIAPRAASETVFWGCIGCTIAFEIGSHETRRGLEVLI